MRANNTPPSNHTDQGPQGCAQYEDQVEYWSLSTASEAFLIFITQP